MTALLMSNVWACCVKYKKVVSVFSTWQSDLIFNRKNILFRRMECNDINYITFTNVTKMHATLLNSKVSKNIRNQGETLFCWAFAISTMLRQSLNLFLENFVNFQNMDVALKKLNSDDFHRQLRNELIMIPIPKIFWDRYHYEFVSQLSVKINVVEFLQSIIFVEFFL